MHIFFLLTILYIFCFLHCHDDTELNLGPRKLKENTFSICHWNLNGITAHNFSKPRQLRAYMSTYKHDVICLPETYLDYSIPNNLIGVKEYNLVCADHPNSIKRGGVCIYYRVSPCSNQNFTLL